jgi:hypothetical protein
VIVTALMIVSLRERVTVERLSGSVMHGKARYVGPVTLPGLKTLMCTLRGGPEPAPGGQPAAGAGHRQAGGQYRGPRVGQRAGHR